MDPEAEQRCNDKLRQVGLWGENLATLELSAAEGVAQQLVGELGLSLYDDVVFWVSQCIEEAKLQAPLLSRARGLHGPSLNWMGSHHKTDEHGSKDPGASAPSLALPAKGERKRKRRPETEAEGANREALERQEREALCLRFKVILERKAPCLAEFSGDFDQGRIAMVVSGRIRNSSLKRYLRFLEEFIFWMHRAKLRDPPFSSGDAIDYLFMLADKPCGPTVPGAFVKSLAWFERVSGFSNESRISSKSVLLSARDVLVKELKKPGVPVHRAPRLPGAVIAARERLVSNRQEAMGIRAGAFYRLLKCWVP